MSMGGCIGIDGCKIGWICVSMDNETRQLKAMLINNIADINFNSYDYIAIDIPIGLPASGSRECDIGARAFIKPRGCCVFPAPIRPMLRAKDYTDACNIKFKVDGIKISVQTWNIMPKIIEVDNLLQNQENRKTLFTEIHPEVSFCCMNGDRPLLINKKLKDGRKDRIQLIDAAFGSGTFQQLKSSIVPSKGWGNDDLLDACAALWTAKRIKDKKAHTIPDQFSNDGTELPMRIVY